MAGTLYIVSAPSGAGKTSLVKSLIQTLPGVAVSVSFTTRAPRAMEVNGKDYHFVSVAEFEHMVAQGDFLETARIYENWYGTSKRAIQQQLETHDVVLEIDWQGARQVLTAFDRNAVTVFILPPSLAVLEQRLRGRGQDAESVIQRRLSMAKEEIEHANEYQFIIVNDEFEKASQDLVAVVRTFRLHQTRQASFLKRLLIEG